MCDADLQQLSFLLQCSYKRDPVSTQRITHKCLNILSSLPQLHTATLQAVYNLLKPLIDCHFNTSTRQEPHLLEKQSTPCSLHPQEEEQITPQGNLTLAHKSYMERIALAKPDSTEAITGYEGKMARLRAAGKVQVECEMRQTPFSVSEVVVRPSPPPLSHGPSAELPAASAAVELRYSAHYGRHLVAAQDIQIGDVLVVDTPFAMSLACPEGSSETPSHCSHCLARSNALLPCTNCAWALYCSAKCLSEAAGSYHPLECGVLPLLTSMEPELAGDTLALLLRVVATIGIDTLQRLLHEERQVEPSEDPESLRTRGFDPQQGVYLSSDPGTVLHLSSCVQLHPAPQLLVSCCLLLQLARCMEACGTPLPEELLPWLLRLYWALCLNSQGAPELQVHPDGRHRVENIGTLIAPTHALLSHSCLPNCEPILCRDKLVVLASEPIREGDLLTIGYCQPFYAMSKKERQQELWENYVFHCTCEACTKNWPTYLNLPDAPADLHLPPPSIPEDLGEPPRCSVEDTVTEMCRAGERHNKLYVRWRRSLINMLETRGNHVIHKT